MTMPDEPLDTRLTLDEVTLFVGCLPNSVVDELAAGPIDGENECRLCQTLWALIDKLGDDPAAHGVIFGDQVAEGNALEEMVIKAGALGAAHSLIDWHDGHAWSDAFLRVRDGLGPVDAKITRRDCKEVQGALQYARCCIVYGLARASVAVRAANEKDPTWPEKWTEDVRSEK